MNGANGKEHIECALRTIGIAKSRNTVVSSVEQEVFELVTFVYKEMVDAHHLKIHRIILSFGDTVLYLVQMGYAHPLLSDKGKNVFFYLGTSAVAGYEDINKGEKLLPDGAKLLDGSRWVYGAGLHTSVELFLTDRMIVSGKAQLRCLFNSDVHRLRPTLSLGLRYQF